MHDSSDQDSEELGDVAALAARMVLAPLDDNTTHDTEMQLEGSGNLRKAAPSPADQTMAIMAGPYACPSVEDIEHLFDRPPTPLLPLPAPVTPRTRTVMAPTVPDVRRSARLGAKPKMHAMDKAIQVLSAKMGVATEGIPLIQARDEYIKRFKTQLPDKTIEALTVLFKLNVRSMMNADEALISLGGPSGAELEPADQEVPV
jgi:hypothetical protein